MRKITTIILFIIMSFTKIYSQSTVYKSAPIGTYGGIMNPDLSVVVDTLGLFTDDKTDEERNKVLLKRAEIVFGGYLYPGIRGDFVSTFENEYVKDNKVETEIHLEEAYISFLELPLGLQMIVGRKLVDFGKLNQYHPHHWPFVDTPLALERLFGHHPWLDDRLNLSFLVPNPLDIYFKTSLSVLNGTPLDEGLNWTGRVYNSRVSLDIKWINSVVGYSRAWDEKNSNIIECYELTYKYQWPGTFRKLKLQNELTMGQKKDEKIYPGFYSSAIFGLSQYTDIGLRYDGVLSEENKIDESAISVWLTKYFTHSFYLRGQYQYKTASQHGHNHGEHEDEHKTVTENKFYLQLSWGIGPHAHRIED